MSGKMKTCIHRASLPSDIKGRMTRPSVGIQDRAFVYVPAIRTNLSETFRRARAELGVLKTVDA